MPNNLTAIFEPDVFVEPIETVDMATVMDLTHHLNSLQSIYKTTKRTKKQRHYTLQQLLQCCKEISTVEYFSRSEINHSLIVDYENDGPIALQAAPKPSTDAMMFGSLVDCLLTSIEEFTTRYVIVEDDQSLTPKEKSLFDALYDIGFRNAHAINDESNESYLLTAAKTADYYQHYKTETLVKAIRKLANRYEQFVHSCALIPVTQTVYNQAMQCVQVLKTHPMTQWLFQNEQLTLYYQVPIFDDDRKALFDILAVDEENKIIYPIDLKTLSYPESAFLKQSFYKFRYYRQAELYLSILNDKLAKLDITGYRVEDMRFLTICAKTLSPTFYRFPIIYNDQKQLCISDTKTVPPITTLIEEIQWCRKHPQIFYTPEVYAQLLKTQSEDQTDKPIIDINIFTNLNSEHGE